MGDLLDRRLHQLARRQRLAALFALSLPGWVLALVAGTVAVVLLRALDAAGPVTALVLTGVILVLPVLVAAWQLRRLPENPAQLAGALDRLCGGEGLAMALAAQPAPCRDPDWLARLRRPLEDLRWPAARPHGLRRLLLPVAALSLAALLPSWRTAPPAVLPWEEFFKPTAGRVSALTDAGLLPLPELAELDRRLDELKNQAARSGMDAVLWQGLDAIDRTARAGLEQSARRLGETLSQAERVHRAQSGSALDTGLAALARSVAELAQQAPGTLPLAEESSDLGRQLRRLLKEQALPAGLSPAQLQAMAGGLIRPGQPQPFDDAAAQELSERLRAHLDALREQLAAAGCEGCQGDPRQEFADEEPGHVPLHLDHQTQEGAGLAADLPAGARLNADGSITLAEERRAAELDEAALQALQRAAAHHFDPGAADARRSSVAPRHRAAVGRYFSEGQPE